jgi:AraC-like DNA-binding protein
MKGAGGFQRPPDAKGAFRYRCDRVRRYAAELRRRHELSRATADALDVLIRIMLGGTLTSTVTPHRETLADLIGCSPRTVTRLIAELEAALVLEVDRDDPHRTKGGGWHRRRCNRYRLLTPPETRKPRSPAGDTGDTRSESVPTDRNPDPPARPVDRGHGPPHQGPTELGRSIIRQIKEARGIA